MRHISTITPEEGAGLWNAVMPAKYCPFRGSAYSYKAKDHLPDRVVFMRGVERMGIYFDTGRIWAESDLTTRIEIDREKAREYLSGIGIELPLI